MVGKTNFYNQPSGWFFYFQEYIWEHPDFELKTLLQTDLFHLLFFVVNYRKVCIFFMKT
jgi:hypothetical protein